MDPTAAIPGAAGGTFANPLDLDRLFHEGDDQTWQVEDWNWDPYQMLAEPRGSPAPAACQALKRHKTDHRTQQQAATNSSHCSIPANPAAYGMAQQLQPGQFQALLLESGNCSTGAWPQQQQQQQVTEGLSLSATGNAAANAGTGCCCPSGNQPASGTQQAGRCHALSGGLSFLQPFNMAAALQQQLPAGLAGMSNPAAITNTAPPGLGPAAAPSGLQHSLSDASELAALQRQQLQPGAAMQLHPQHMMQSAHAADAATAAAAGLDCSSVAESASDGYAPVSTPLQQSAAAALGHYRMPPAAAAAWQGGAVAAAATSLSPSTMPSATPDRAAVAAQNPDNEAAAAAAGGGGVGDDSSDEQKMVCQVPGCARDLSGLKEYHQRYRICDVHIKLPQVMKDGRLQRFCQQCGRFHDLAAFDGNRKSCREQLQKHNARRRRRAQMEQNMSLADSLLAAVDDKSDVGKLLQGLLSNPFQLQALRVLLGVQTHQALPKPAPHPAEHAPALTAAGALPGVAGAQPTPVAAPQTYEVARDIMNGTGAFPPTFDSDHRVMRLSAKMFNTTPADMPPDLRQVLTGWLASAPAAIESYIRPGCVLLSMHMTVTKCEYEEAKQSGMQRLLQQVLSATAHPFWNTHTVMLQLFGHLAVIYNGMLVSFTSLNSAAALHQQQLPHGVALSPPCILAGEDTEIQVSGANISAADCTIVIKGGGKHIKLSSARQSDSGCAAGSCACSKRQQQACPAVTAATGGVAAAQLETVRSMLHVPASSVGCQVLWVEMARGAFVAEPRPLLVVDDPELAQEVASLQQLEGSCLSPSQVDALLLDLGLVLSHIHSAAAAGSTAGSKRSSSSTGSSQPHQLSHAAIADKARRLIAFACDQGWVAVACAVLPLALACGDCAHDIVSAVHQSSAQDGLTLLHRAVRSGSPSLVRGILDWGTANNYTWPISTGGPGGITPLHLAALLDDDGVVALMLLDACDGMSSFTDTRAADGVTPFHLAFQVGHYSVDRVLAGLGIAPIVRSVVEQQMQPTGWQLLKKVAEASDTDAATAGGVTCTAGSAAAAYAAETGAPLRERHTSCLDACLYCQSTLPPLLLSIKATCAGCGVRQPCVQGGNEPNSPSAAIAAAAEQQQRQQSLDEAAAATAVAAAAAAVAALDAGCSHESGRVLSVTALCQSCHANRVLEVA